MFQREHKDKDSNTITSIVWPLPLGKGFFNAPKLKKSLKGVKLWNLNQCY